MARKTTSEATVLITGPGCEGREVAGLYPALALAQNMAVHHDADGTWYVRAPEGKWAVEKQGKVVTTRQLVNGEQVPDAPKPVLAPEVDL